MANFIFRKFSFRHTHTPNTNTQIGNGRKQQQRGFGSANKQRHGDCRGIERRWRSAAQLCPAKSPSSRPFLWKRQNKIRFGFFSFTHSLFKWHISHLIIVVVVVVVYAKAYCRQVTAWCSSQCSRRRAANASTTSSSASFPNTTRPSTTHRTPSTRASAS